MLHGARRPAGDKPNLLFRWTDEHRADTLAAYGNHRFRVPTLNKLAESSIVFERCYDPAFGTFRSRSVSTIPHATPSPSRAAPPNGQTNATSEGVSNGKWTLLRSVSHFRQLHRR